MKKQSKKMKLFAGMAGSFFIFGCLFLPVLPVFAATAEGDKAQELLISSFTTSFDAGNTDRAYNISLACKYLNGCKIEGGESFSFNRRVGERTVERGFKNAAVILDGQFVPGCGGGVCQVSTTLYNAALLSGMDVTEVHAHSLKVGYVAPSLDAMVSSYSDLKFKNPASTPVAIRTRVASGKVTVEFYGRGDGFSYGTESVILSVIEPPAPEVTEGEQDLVLKEEKEGVRSESYLIRYRHGRRVSSRRIRRDGYAAVRGMVQKKREELPADPAEGEKPSPDREKTPIREAEDTES